MLFLPDSVIYGIGVVVLLAMAIIVMLCFVVISKGSKWQYAAIVCFLVSTVGIVYWANNMITMSGEILHTEIMVYLLKILILDILNLETVEDALCT